MARKYRFYGLLICMLPLIILLIFVTMPSSKKRLKKESKKAINNSNKISIEQNTRSNSGRQLNTAKTEDMSSQDITMLHQGLLLGKKEIDVAHIELPLEELQLTKPFFRPPVWDVIGYMRKDRRILEMIGKTDLKNLVYQRYDLSTPKDIELALTDIYKLFELRNSNFYQSYWPEGQDTYFIDAVLDEILLKDPGNISAMLLKSSVMAEQNKIDGAISTYASQCDAIKNGNKTMFFTELVRAACDLLSSDLLTDEQKNTIKTLSYESGLPKNCPLARHMEGESVETHLNRYIRDNIDPLDFSKSEDFFRPYIPSRAQEKLLNVNVSLLSRTEQRKFAMYRVRSLTMERDPRAMIELAHTFERAKIPDSFAIIARFSAYLMTGRISALVKEVELIKQTKLYHQHPDLSGSIQYNLGRAYYELGDYDKARKAINTALQLDEEQQWLTEEKRIIARKILSRVE